MADKSKIYLVVFLIMLVSLGILKVNGFSLFGINFGFNSPEQSKRTPQTITYSEPQLKDINILEFYPELDLVSSKENATVKFLVFNGLKVPYNITVEYYLGDKYIWSWFNISTEIYNETKSANQYYSFVQTLGSVGNWTAQLYVDYSYLNYSFRKSKTTSFKVVDKTPATITTVYYKNNISKYYS